MADKTYVPGVDENYTSNAPDSPDVSERRSQNPGMEHSFHSKTATRKLKSGTEQPVT